MASDQDMNAALVTENSISNLEGVRRTNLGAVKRRAFDRKDRKGKAAKDAKKSWIDRGLAND
jgi:hypothetical protein